MPKKGVIPPALRAYVKKKNAGSKGGSKKKMPAGLAKKLGKPGMGAGAV
jgi:hypothetical protein